jgi:hypothetical protein
VSKVIVKVELTYEVESEIWEESPYPLNWDRLPVGIGIEITSVRERVVEE